MMKPILKLNAPLEEANVDLFISLLKLAYHSLVPSSAPPHASTPMDMESLQERLQQATTIDA